MDDDSGEAKKFDPSCPPPMPNHETDTSANARFMPYPPMAGDGRPGEPWSPSRDINGYKAPSDRHNGPYPPSGPYPDCYGSTTSTYNTSSCKRESSPSSMSSSTHGSSLQFPHHNNMQTWPSDNTFPNAGEPPSVASAPSCRQTDTVPPLPGFNGLPGTYQSPYLTAPMYPKPEGRSFNPEHGMYPSSLSKPAPDCSQATLPHTSDNSSIYPPPISIPPPPVPGQSSFSVDRLSGQQDYSALTHNGYLKPPKDSTFYQPMQSLNRLSLNAGFHNAKHEVPRSPRDGSPRNTSYQQNFSPTGSSYYPMSGLPTVSSSSGSETRTPLYPGGTSGQYYDGSVPPPQPYYDTPHPHPDENRLMNVSPSSQVTDIKPGSSSSSVLQSSYLRKSYLY